MGVVPVISELLMGRTTSMQLTAGPASAAMAMPLTYAGTYFYTTNVPLSHMYILYCYAGKYYIHSTSCNVYYSSTIIIVCSRTL